MTSFLASSAAPTEPRDGGQSAPLPPRRASGWGGPPDAWSRAAAAPFRSTPGLWAPPPSSTDQADSCLRLLRPLPRVLALPLLRVLPGGRAAVSSMQYDHTGDLLAIGSESATVSLFGTADLFGQGHAAGGGGPSQTQPLHTLKTGGGVLAVRWHPRHEDIAVCTAGDTAVCIYSLLSSSDKPSHTLTRTWGPGAGAVGYGEGNTDVVFLADVRAPLVSMAESARVTDVGTAVQTSSGTLLCAGDGGGRVRLWDLRTRGNTGGLQWVADCAAATRAAATAPLESLGSRLSHVSATSLPGKADPPTSTAHDASKGRPALSGFFKARATGNDGKGAAETVQVGSGRTLCPAPPLPMRPSLHDASSSIARVWSPEPGSPLLQAVTVAGAVLTWDTRRVAKTGFTNDRTPACVSIWDAHAQLEPLGFDTRGTHVQAVHAGYPNGDCRSVTFVHSNGWMSEHERETGRLLRAAPAVLTAEEKALGGEAEARLSVFVPRAATCVSSGGWLWVAQRRTLRRQPSLAERGLGARTHFRGTVGAVGEGAEELSTFQALAAMRFGPSPPRSRPDTGRSFTDVAGTCCKDLRGDISAVASAPGLAGVRDPCSFVVGTTAGDVRAVTLCRQQPHQSPASVADMDGW